MKPSQFTTISPNFTLTLPLNSESAWQQNIPPTVIKTVHTPGHTVDHICAWNPETGTLLTGDHVLPSITPHVSGVRKADSLKS